MTLVFKGPSKKIGNASSLLFTSTAMISGSVVVPFQKGPCGEGGRMRGFLLPLLEAAVVVLVLFLLILVIPPFVCGFFHLLFSVHLHLVPGTVPPLPYNTKANRIKLSKIKNHLQVFDGF